MNENKIKISCEIHWNRLSAAEWEEQFSQIHRSNLLQSYDYARSICPLQNQRARWGVIEIGGQKAGLVQILEAGALWNMLHAVVVDRGPLWFDGFGTPEHLEVFLEAFRKEFSKRWGRKTRFIPEVETSSGIEKILKTYNFEKADKTQYQTYFLDLTQSADVLHAGLKKNWRNMLSRAEREDIKIEWDDDYTHIGWLLKTYALDKAKKSYSGASIKLIHAMAQNFGSRKKMLLGRAIKDGKAVAAALHFMHGSGATYQIGWTSASGRNIGAQNLLLWQSCIKLQELGIKDFDLGGYNDTQNKGLQTFKGGMGGHSCALPGLYT